MGRRENEPCLNVSITTCAIAFSLLGLAHRLGEGTNPLSRLNGRANDDERDQD